MITHPELVQALMKPGADILASLTPEKADLWHAASCIPGEGGELFDAIKRHVIYGKELDVENVIEELGDLEFYIERVRAIVGITRQQTLHANIMKLSRRYTEMRFTNEHAIERADKAGTE